MLLSRLNVSHGLSLRAMAMVQTPFHCYLLNVLLSLSSLGYQYLLLNTFSTSFYLKQRVHVHKKSCAWHGKLLFYSQGDTFHTFTEVDLVPRERVDVLGHRGQLFYNSRHTMASCVFFRIRSLQGSEWFSISILNERFLPLPAA